MGTVIAVSNQKGGVAKTTSTMSVGVALAELGLSVLLVDLDPQGGLTLSCGFPPDELEKTVYDSLMRRVPPEEILLHTDHGVDLLPANIDLSIAEMELVHAPARERRIAAMLAPFREAYDVILIDCQPSLGLLTVNALAVADQVLIPVACEFLAIRGVKVLFKMLGKVRLRINSRLEVVGILPTMYDSRTNHSKDTLEEIKKTFQGQCRVFDIVINRSIRFAEATAQGQPIFKHAPQVPGAEGYRLVARELVTLLSLRPGTGVVEIR